MIRLNTNARASLLLAVAVTLLTMGLPLGTGTPAATAAGLSAPAANDAWLNRSKPRNNYGTATLLRAASGESETLLRFNVSAWKGKSIASLALSVGNVLGDVTGLVVDRTESGWKESTVNWNLRPKTLSTLVGANPAQQVTSGTTQFDVKASFPSGVVDRAAVWLRIRNTKASVVTFGSRESTKKPTLTLTAGQTPLQTRIKPIGDTWIDSASPAKTHGGAAYLLVDAQAKRDAFLKFDVSKWRGHRYTSLKLQLRIRTAGGAGVSVYRSGSSWSESTLNWKTRPATLGLLATVSPAPTTGTLVIDLSAAFPDGLVSTDRFSIRIATINSRGFDFSAREGSTPAILEMVEQAPTPPPTPSPSPTATGTPSPTSAPTSTPSATPSPTPAPTSTLIATASVCPTPIPTATSTATSTPTPTSTPIPTGTPNPTSTPGPTPMPTAEPLFYFLGHGTDHGVGMSQVGAKGRALAGHTYSQILNFYYTGVEFSTVDGTQPIRVRLSDSFWPTATKPARVTGYIGGWRSDTFPGVSFPQGSYVQIAPTGPGPTPSPTPDPCGNLPVPTAPPTPSPSGVPPESWIATAYDSTGAVLASATTNDLTVTATDPEGVLRMAHRDEQVGYTTYRGSMRMVVMPTGLQTINTLPMEQYLRGVVPAESPASWPIEAVKAQAVAARTYAWQRLKRTVNWDVLPDSANQNYGGWQHERTRSDAAIIATANQVLTYQGAVISAVYHSASGGHTENSEYSFTNARGDPGNVVPYLRGKPDVDANGVAYDINASSYDWQSAQFTMSQLSTIFGRNTQTDVGDIYSIDYLRGVSGRVYQVVLTGSEGTKTVSGGRFKNIYNDNKMSGAKVLSAMFYLTPVPPSALPSTSP